MLHRGAGSARAGTKLTTAIRRARLTAICRRLDDPGHEDVSQCADDTENDPFTYSGYVKIYGPTEAINPLNP